MLKWKYLSIAPAMLYNYAWFIVQMLCNLSFQSVGLRDYITAHLNSIRALFYNKATKIEIHFQNSMIQIC